MTIFNKILSLFIKSENFSKAGFFSEILINGEKAKIKSQEGGFLVCQNSKGEFTIRKRDLFLLKGKEEKNDKLKKKGE